MHSIILVSSSSFIWIWCIIHYNSRWIIVLALLHCTWFQSLLQLLFLSANYLLLQKQKSHILRLEQNLVLDGSHLLPIFIYKKFCFLRPIRWLQVVIEVVPSWSKVWRYNHIDDSSPTLFASLFSKISWVPTKFIAFIYKYSDGSLSYFYYLSNQ